MLVRMKSGMGEWECLVCFFVALVYIDKELLDTINTFGSIVCQVYMVGLHFFALLKIVI